MDNLPRLVGSATEMWEGKASERGWRGQRIAGAQERMRVMFFCAENAHKLCKVWYRDIFNEKSPLECILTGMFV